MSKNLLPPLTALFSLTLALTACGQKGPLYLPQEPAVPAQPAVAQPAAAGEKEEEEKEEENQPQAQQAGADSVEPEAEK